MAIRRCSMRCATISVYRSTFRLRPDEAIMSHTRHRSLTTMRGYVRRAKLSRESRAGKLRR